jgi:transposase
MAAVIRRYEITDEEWEHIKHYIPEEQGAGSRGRPSKDSRTMLNGILWILRSGAAWRDLPERYGPWQTVYKRFVKWSEAGIHGLRMNKFHDNFLKVIVIISTMSATSSH